MDLFGRSRRLLPGAAFLIFAATANLWGQSDNLIQKSQRGKELMAEGQFEAAIPVYEDLVKALPNNPGLLLNLAMAEEMAGHADRAIPHFESVLKSQPDNIPALMSLSMARLQLNQPGAALAPLKRLVALDANNADACGMLAGVEMALGKLNEAAGEYRKLTTLAPSDPKAWFGLGKAYEGLASATFDKLAKLAPQSGFLASLIAETRVQRGQYRSAFFFYRDAEKKMPNLPGIHAGLANVYRKTGHPEWAQSEERLEAERSAQDCRAQPEACRFTRQDFLSLTNSATTNRDAATLYWATRAYNELALASFDSLGRLPESTELHVLKAQILHDHGQNLAAAGEWRSALALSQDKNDPRLKTELATSLFLAHDYQAAMPMIEELLSANPTSADLNFMLGESLWRTQQAEQALPHLERAIQESPNMLPAHAALGLALVSIERSADAIPHLEKALTLDDDGSLHYSLARAYQATGNKERSRQNMEEYTRIQHKNAEINDNLAKEAEISAPSAP